MATNNGPKIIWKSTTRKLSELIPWVKNPRKIDSSKFEKLVEQIKNAGFTAPIIINTDNVIIAGHQRREALLHIHGTEDIDVDVRIPSRKLNNKDFEDLAIGDNLYQGVFDTEKLSLHFKADKLLGLGFEKWELGNLKNDLRNVINPTETEDDETDTGVTNTSSSSSNGSADPNAPSQSEFDKQSNSNVGSESEQVSSEDKMMPYEVLIKISTRKQFIELVSNIKNKYQFETTDEAFAKIVELTNQNI